MMWKMLQNGRQRGAGEVVICCESLGLDGLYLRFQMAHFQGNIKIAASLGEIDGDWEGANG
jgi:hypothetical protein